MITTPQERITETSSNMRGGDGDAHLTALFEEHIPHLRLLKVIELGPGCSIGKHQHEGEAEIFYALEGVTTVLEDDGEYRTLQVGDAHLCRDGEFHSLLNRSSAPCKVLAIIPTLAK